MAPEPSNVHENAAMSKGVDRPQVPADGTDDTSKALRHPRWTRQETFVLIQGKKVADNRVGRGGRRSSSDFGSDQLEPKWDSISSYCKQNGVNRGPVQCRKRWSNLLGDFRKIKTWESHVKEEAESFWMMRNDVRRERKLPSMFDREVYDVLDGRAFTEAVFPLALVAVMEDAKNGNAMGPTVVEEVEDEDEEEEAEAVFDSGRQAAAEDGLFSDFEQSGKEEIGESPVKETIVTESLTKTVSSPLPNSGTTKEKQPGSNLLRGSISQEGWKRRRLSLVGCGETNREDQLIKVLERNSDTLTAQLEAHNSNCQLDRDQQKDHTDSLVAALSKLTDALVRIADKL
ncbi:hypothetical protein L1049_028537 [Liquidambar formosana]|uniref:Myb-like domain-containing protein n=1 Tax=Liquidambar formosana TaxID=63359 RepID=A0AAP0RJU5_LIQFO